MTKDDAVAQLIGIRAALLYAFVLENDVDDAKLAAKMRGKQYGFAADNGEVAGVLLNPLAQMLEQEPHRRVVKNNYQIIMRQTLVRLSHEIAMQYAEESAQFPAYKAAPFFQFARVWRNVYSHKDGAVLHMWPSDLTKQGIQSVAWEGRTISVSDVGQQVNLDSWAAFKLHDHIAWYVHNSLR